MDPSAVTDLASFLSGEAPEPPASLGEALRAQAAAARAFARGDAPPPRGLDAEVARAVCHLLATSGDGARLARAAADGDKPLAKEARRALHVLRSRGAAVSVPRPAGRAEPLVAHADAEPEVESIASMIDARGERGVWLCRRDPAKGGITVYQTVLSEDRGLVELVTGRATRKSYRELTRDLTRNRDFTAALVPTAYARWLIEQATARTQAIGRALPPGYAQARADLGPAARPAVHPALVAWPDAPSLDDAAAAALFELPELRGWIPDEDVVRAVALKLAEVDESRLLIDDKQKAAARRDVLEREIPAYWTAARREGFRERLLETAYLLHRAGRDADGLRLRAAADTLAPRAPETPPNAFMRRLFERVLPVEPPVLAAGPAGPAPLTPSGLIVSPYERPPQR
ncbi:MAG TPA: hypothetical protein VGQ83_14790 [Polyangia bacterium]